MSGASEKVVKVGEAELRVVSERYNRLAGRIEVQAVVAHTGMPTPSRRAVAEALGRLYSRSPELVVVRSIESEYGVGMSTVYAHVYEDLGRLRDLEPEHVLRRHGAGA